MPCKGAGHLLVPMHMLAPAKMIGRRLFYFFFTSKPLISHVFVGLRHLLGTYCVLGVPGRFM